MDEPEVIYLEPICPECQKLPLFEEIHERLWCREDVWDRQRCEGCDNPLPETPRYERVKK